MTAREIANLCCRVFAIYALFQGLVYLPSLGLIFDPVFGGTTSGFASSIARLLWSLHPVFMFAAAAFLWRWSWLVASWMVGHDIQDAVAEPESARQRATLAEIQAVAFSVIGLWLLVHVTVDLAEDAAYLVYTEAEVADRGWIASYFRMAVQLALGIWLLFGARGLVRLLHRLRRVGLDQPELDGPDDGA
ncbi:MAG: hypothetical protein GY715_18175 [Planctomycetes bacterium]|nr:hypothetical protein [Planctomycetota bacterium]